MTAGAALAVKSPAHCQRSRRRLSAHLHRLSGRGYGKQYFNLRLAPGDVSDALTGYTHNGVSPIGLATRLPIVLSDAVVALSSPSDNDGLFFLGAGEVDLKVGLLAREFVAAYEPLVLDITY